MENEMIPQNEERTKQKGIKKGMQKSAIFFLIIVLLQIPIGVVVAVLMGRVPEDYASLISILVAQGYLLIAAIIYIIVTKSSLKEDIRIRKYKISTFFLSFIMLATATPMANLLNVLSQIISKNEIGNAIFNITEVIPGWLAIMIVGCMPGFTEEVIFRGIMHNSFRKKSVLTGIIVSAVSFGLMHMNFNQMIYAIYLGVIFALLNEATGSVVSSMVLHMVFNGLNTAMVFALPKLYEYLAQYSSEFADFNMEEALNATQNKAQLIMTVGMMAPVAIMGLVLAILLLKAIAKINGKELTWASITKVQEGAEQVKTLNIPLIVCWVICLGFSVMALMR